MQGSRMAFWQLVVELIFDERVRAKIVGADLEKRLYSSAALKYCSGFTHGWFHVNELPSPTHLLPPTTIMKMHTQTHIHI